MKKFVPQSHISAPLRTVQVPRKVKDNFTGLDGTSTDAGTERLCSLYSSRFPLEFCAHHGAIDNTVRMIKFFSLITLLAILSDAWWHNPLFGVHFQRCRSQYKYADKSRAASEGTAGQQQCSHVAPRVLCTDHATHFCAGHSVRQFTTHFLVWYSSCRPIGNRFQQKLVGAIRSLVLSCLATA